jgi:hypothetical protein
MEDAAKAYWERVDPLVQAIYIYDGPDAFLASIDTVPRGATLVFAADFCLYEIQNGGLLQFFSNSTGVLAPEALEGFAAIGMPDLAAVLGTAVSLLGQLYPRQREARIKALLVAAGNSEEPITTILSDTKNRLRSLRDATRSLGLDDLDRKIYKLANAENGGFDSAKESYVSQLPFCD